MKVKKTLVLGSGALKIGEAGEFDYSGSQAIKALKEEGIKTVLINPNIATVQTSENLADRVYFLPVTPAFVERVIHKEKPDSILLSFGGQTALNCGIALHKAGILKKNHVTILGTPIEAVIMTEDREKFARHLISLSVPVPESQAVQNIEAAVKVAKKIGYPIMMRAAYSLGGQKSGIVENERELRKRALEAFSFSNQLLIEKYLHHYKEIEYEVVRDCDDNCITVCNMENMDPLGIHTGESIVVAPSQTLTNLEYHTLRKVSIEIVRSLGIVGECNVQFALNPNPKNGQIEYYVIEVNARLSRSSALASKATGYPLAYVAAKLALRHNLGDIGNKVTGKTSAMFEPALDYIVVKIPRWDLEKFPYVERRIGSSMKSVGEVMAIGRTFEEAFQKAVRMLEIGSSGVTSFSWLKKREYQNHISVPTPWRMFALATALKKRSTVRMLHRATGINLWFLYRIQAIVDCEVSLVNVKKKNKKDKVPCLKKAKELGFSDRRIGELWGLGEMEVRDVRKQNGIIPSVFLIDTVAGEAPAQTNYLYMTYGGSHNDVKPLGKKGIIVLGSGPYRIGSSVEFDWSCVKTVEALQKYSKLSIVINCNPETVSTDFDISNRLYFEELTFERVADIVDFEQPDSLIISVGGQTPNNLSQKLATYGVPILGTQSRDINRAEDRNIFSSLLDELQIAQPYWKKLTDIKSVAAFVRKIGFPVLIRPSYVLSGAAMRICYTKEEMNAYIRRALGNVDNTAITVSRFIRNAKELEFDGVAQNGKLIASVIAEHIEEAGIHSGDATIAYPPQKVYLRTEQKIYAIAARLVEALNISGPFNIQFIAKNNDVYVIEMNVRASRTLPLVSKVTGVNFPELAVDACFNNAKPTSIPYPDYVIVKTPQFSFSRLEGADPVLRVEMSSTGEVACIGKDVEEAYLKAEFAVGGKMPQKGIFISLGGDENKVKFLESAMRLSCLGLPLYATEKTAQFLKRNGIKTMRLFKIHEERRPNLITYMKQDRIDLAVVIPDHQVEMETQDYYTIRRSVVDHNIQLFTNRHKAELFIIAITKKTEKDLEIKAWDEYVLTP